MKKIVTVAVLFIVLFFEQFFKKPTDTAVLYPDKSPEEISAITDSLVTAHFSDVSDKVDKLFARYDTRRTPGAAVAVIQDGLFLHRKGYGLADLRTKQPIEPETCFMLASITKTFTSMAIMILKEEGKLSYDDTLPKYFSNIPKRWNTITIKQLLTHTSGIPDRFYLIGYGEGFKNEDILNRLIEHRLLDFMPGRRHKYSNSGYNLLAMIIEKVSGSPFRVFLKERIFDPLGMKNTIVYDETEPNIENRAIAYRPRGRRYRPNDFLLYTTGASGIFSNVDDLCKWDHALYTESLVSEETLREAFEMHVQVSRDEHYGFGWRLAGNDELKAVFHTGSLGGVCNIFFRIPEKRFAVIILTNAHIRYTKELTRRITEYYHPGLIDRLNF